MNNELDELYLTWLYSQVSSVKLKTPSRTYWALFRHLYNKEYVWFIPNDDNRVQDGRDLRFEFLDEREINDPDPAWMDLGCSMLEFLIALSRRAAFKGEGKPKYWFWLMLENVDLARFNDKKYRENEEGYSERIDATLDHIIWRTYAPSGMGNIFPLREPRENQRDVEVAYQLNAYIIEMEELGAKGA